MEYQSNASEDSSDKEANSSNDKMDIESSSVNIKDIKVDVHNPKKK